MLFHYFVRINDLSFLPVELNQIALEHIHFAGVLLAESDECFFEHIVDLVFSLVHTISYAF